MNKRIIIGSVLVLTLLLLMPSIPALQFKKIEEKTSEDYFQKQKDIDLKELLEKNNYWRHPILNILSLITAIRAFRGYFLMLLSLDCPFNPDDYPKVENHLYFIRGIWLLSTGAVLNSLLYILANNMGWEFNSLLIDFYKELGIEFPFKAGKI